MCNRKPQTWWGGGTKIIFVEILTGNFLSDKNYKLMGTIRLIHFRHKKQDILNHIDKRSKWQSHYNSWGVGGILHTED